MNAPDALALASVGVFGVMSYAVRERTQEIGTRMALGATGRDILWSVLRQGLGITAAGLALGLAVSLVAARYVPARRAARVDPARTLASE